MAETTTKSFWQKPEGKTGKVLLWILGGIGAVGLYFLMPFIRTFFEEAVKTGLAAAYSAAIFGGLTALYFFFTSGPVKAMIWNAFHSFTRFVTSFYVEMDGINILKNYIEELERKLVEIREGIRTVRGQIGKLAKKIGDQTNEMNESFEKAQAARKLGGRDMEVGLHSSQAQRLKNGIDKLQKMHNKLEFLAKMLDKMANYSDIMKQDTENKVKILIDENEAITTSYRVMTKAEFIINGGGEKKKMFDEAVANLSDNVGTKMGFMNSMMEASMETLKSIDLDNEVLKDKGLKALEEFEKQGLDTMFGDSTMGYGQEGIGGGSTSLAQDADKFKNLFN